MQTQDDSKQIRAIGRLLKTTRESQGDNLAILAGKCDTSVLQLAALERGDKLVFAKSGLDWATVAKAYARELDLPIDSMLYPDEIDSKEPSDDGIYIPLFLRKTSAD